MNSKIKRYTLHHLLFSKFLCTTTPPLPSPQTLQKEIQGHQPRYDDIFERSHHVLKKDGPMAEQIGQRLSDFRSLWDQIKKETEKRHERLNQAHQAQQYFFDAAEVEAWMSEQ